VEVLMIILIIIGVFSFMMRRGMWKLRARYKSTGDYELVCFLYKVFTFTFYFSFAIIILCGVIKLV